MRAFASDLDRTLIYSKKMIEMYETNENYELIETLDGKEISFISTKTKQALKQLNHDMLFIPVTTRTVEQYQRISIFQEEIQPEYAITSNGGVILKGGVVDQQWAELLEGKLSQCMPLQHMIEKIEQLPNTSWIERIRHAEQLFIYLIINREKLSQVEIHNLKEWSTEHGWQMSLQGRKLYFVPNPINKWDAVQYLCNKLAINEVYTAGDSLLDYELIINGHYGLSPAHGEVLVHYPNINKTNSYGLNASNDIIDIVKNKVLLNL